MFYLGLEIALQSDNTTPLKSLCYHKFRKIFIQNKLYLIFSSKKVIYFGYILLYVSLYAS